ncbi:MAG TPA: hypothetical protein VGR54_05575 [Nitrosopumilaceae archaeon]|nr:hypothetical protein [Nitrosopumilaceae archaeon]
MDKVVIDKLKEFVEKIKSKEWEIAPRANEILLWDGKAILAVWLAKAMSDFEIAKEPKPVTDRVLVDVVLSPNWRSLEDNKKREYEKVIEKFNEMVNQANIHNVVTDNKSKKELKECQEKRSELENQLKDIRSLNTQLAEDKIKIENVIRDIFKEYSAIRDKFKNKLPTGFFDDDDDPPESEITHG